jgi:hypothetical protein
MKFSTAVLSGLLIAGVAGCSTGPTTSELKVADRRTALPSARVAVDLAGADGPRSEPHTSHAVELGFTGARGSDKQTLAAGDKPVVFGGQSFNGPDQLRNEFHFGFVELAYRYRKFFGNSQSLGVEGLAGLGYAHLGLTVGSTTTTQRATANLGNAGGVLGVGGIWRFRPTTSLQVRLTGFGTGRNEGVTGASRFDVYVAQGLGRNAALRAGFASWTLRSEREADDSSTSLKSPIRVRFSGPALGLDVMF